MPSDILILILIFFILSDSSLLCFLMLLNYFPVCNRSHMLFALVTRLFASHSSLLVAVYLISLHSTIRTMMSPSKFLAQVLLFRCEYPFHMHLWIFSTYFFLLILKKSPPFLILMLIERIIFYLCQ